MGHGYSLDIVRTELLGAGRTLAEIQRGPVNHAFNNPASISGFFFVCDNYDTVRDTDVKPKVEGTARDLLPDKTHNIKNEEGVRGVWV